MSMREVSPMNEKIEKMAEYLEYIKEHYNNVQKAWEIVQEKCSDMNFIKDGYILEYIDTLINLHDMSKLGAEEFDGYRKTFFPTESEEYYANSVYGCSAKYFFKEDFDKAWEHHKSVNKHHWQNWTNIDGCYIKWYVVEMICDWMAMGMKFGDTAQSYYEKNKDDIFINKDDEEFMYEIFDRLDG